MARPKRCECGGKFVTETLHDDWEGVLTCKKCGKKNHPPKSLYFSDVEASRESITFTKSIADNEIFLRFVNDDDAIAFHEWFMGGEGSILFQKHLGRVNDD